MQRTSRETLIAEDREWLRLCETAYFALQGVLRRRGAPPDSWSTTTLNRRIIAAAWRRVLPVEPTSAAAKSSKRILTQLASLGALTEWQRYLHSQKVEQPVPAASRIRSMPALIGVTLPLPSGGRGAEIQIPMFLADWDQLERRIAADRRQRDAYEDRVVMLSQVLALREQYPGARTPAEALQLAGQDPQDFWQLASV